MVHSTLRVELNGCFVMVLTIAGECLHLDCHQRRGTPCLSTRWRSRPRPSALAQYFSGRPTVHTAMRRMNGLLETHGSAILRLPTKPSTRDSIAAHPHDGRLSLKSRHSAVRNVSQSTLHHRKTETGMHLHEIDYSDISIRPSLLAAHGLTRRVKLNRINTGQTGTARYMKVTPPAHRGGDTSLTVIASYERKTEGELLWPRSREPRRYRH